MKYARLLILMFSLLAIGHAMAMESATLVKDEVLRAKPKANAKVLADVEKGVKVELLRVNGPWYFVKVDGKWQGWLPVASVRRHDATFGTGFGDVGSAGGLPSATEGSAKSIPATPGSAFNR